MDGTLDSYVDSLDKLATTFGESYDQTLKIDHEVLNTVLEDLRESNYTLPDDTKESSLESFKIIPGYRTGMNDMIINEGKRKRIRVEITITVVIVEETTAMLVIPEEIMVVIITDF